MLNPLLWVRFSRSTIERWSAKATRSIGVFCLFALIGAQSVFGQSNPVPGIELKQSVSSVTANNDGSFAVNVTLTVTNTGNEELIKLQLKDNLDIFGPGSSIKAGSFRILSGNLALNPGYDGLNDVKLLTGKDKLLPGKQAIVRFTVTFEPGNSPGPFTNVANAWAEGGKSGKGVDDRAPCTFSLPWKPEASFSKIAGPVVDNENGTHTVNFTLDARNTGNEELARFQFKDDLDIFGDGRLVSVGTLQVLDGDLTLNPDFDGIGDTRLLLGIDHLRPGDRARLSFDVVFEPGATSGTCTNRALLWTEGKHSRIDFDLYKSASFDCQPLKPKASFKKTASTVEATGNGALRVTFTLDATNTGSEELIRLQFKDNLDIFGDGNLVSVGAPRVLDGALSLNPDFDGIGDTRLLLGIDHLRPGDRARLSFDVVFEPGATAGTCTNRALLWTEGKYSRIDFDLYDAASFDCARRERPAISLTKTAGQASPAGGGLYSREIVLVVSNPGTVALDNVQVSDPLDIFGPDGEFVEVSPPSSDGVSPPRSDGTTVEVNGAFDGAADINLLQENQVLAVGESATIRFTVIFRPNNQPGPFTNTATATGEGGYPPSTALDTATADITWERPPEPPAISLTKTAGQASPAGDGLYSREIVLVVSNPGTVALDNVQVSDPLDIFGPDGAFVEVLALSSDDGTVEVNEAFNGHADINLLQENQTLAVGESATISFTVIFRPNNQPGPFTNTATATGEGGYPRSTALDTATADITWERPPEPPPELMLTKTPDRYEVARGDLVRYTVSVMNAGQVDSPDNQLVDVLPAGFQFVPGSAYITRPGSENEQPMSISASGNNPVSFGEFDLDAGKRALVTYQARVGTGVADGKHTNTVTLVGPALKAMATVNVSSENGDPMFESTTIIGKVFDDRDNDGWQSDGEPGIAGVRLATVSGLTIETDEFGRYHIADVPVHRFDRGANFIVKVDESTLPEGARVTSENPRVIRLTQGTMSKVNFAAYVPKPPVPPRTWECIESCVTYEPRTDKANIDPVLFKSGESVFPVDYEEKLRNVLAEYQGKRDVSLKFVGHTDSDPVIGRLERALGVGGAEGNLVLSENRARRVCQYIEANFDVPVDCTQIEGKGQRTPVAGNNTLQGKAKNRRVEIEVTFLEISDLYSYRKVDPGLCAAINTPEEPFFSRDSMQNIHPGYYCNVHRQYFKAGDATASEIRVSGGLFGCNRLVNPGIAGQDAGALPANAKITVNASESGDTEIDAGDCEFLPDYQERCSTATALEAVPGEYPVELRTCAGSVLQVTSAGDVLRKGFPDNNERIVVTPFRDETDGAVVGAFRLSNEGVDRGPYLYRRTKFESAMATQARVTTDPFVMDPRLDVLALDSAIVDGDGNLINDVRFGVYTNYANFIDNYVLEVYGRSGSGFDRRLLAVVSHPTFDFSREFILDAGRINLHGMESLEYVLKAIGCRPDDDTTCYEDRTEPRLLSLVASTTDQLDKPDANELWGMSNLAEQNIPIIGDRVRIEGVHPTERVHPIEGVHPNESNPPNRGEFRIEQMRIGSNEPPRDFVVPLAADRSYVLEQYVPVGRFRYRTLIGGARRTGTMPVSADATGIRVSGGLFGCRTLAGVSLRGRASQGDALPALTVVADTTNQKSGNASIDDNCRADPDSGPAQIVVTTAEGTRIRVTSAGDTFYLSSPNPTNTQQIVVMPFRDYTDNTVVSALRIENEGISVDVPKNELWVRTLDVEVAENQGFLVALANVTVGANDVSGNIAPLSADDHFDGTVFTDGRMALYAKGKIQGKYLLTAQLDSTEDELRNMWDNLKRKDPRRLFRQLDPDRYYPVYGDDSTSTTDVDTQGAFYVRVDWNRNTALWGNFNTGMTGTELAQYNRTLYGASFQHKSQQSTDAGNPENELTLFASEAQSVPAHVTFKATGGSLYYLRDTDIVMGSEKAWIEVRRRDTQQVVETQVLIEGRDYEIDAIQGRIILNQPLSQVVNNQQASIIRSTPLEGDEVYLLVDYEYVPDAFVADDMVLGARGKIWLGDKVSVGTTSVTDNRGDTDYDLEGLDIVIRGQEGTHLSAEFARSEARQSDANSVSFDGGLSFQSQVSANPGSSLRGDATALDGRLNLADLGVIDGLDGQVHGWWKSRDADFSTGRLGQGIDVTDSGVEMRARVQDFMTLSASHTDLNQAQISREKVTRLKAEGKGERLSLGVELRHEKIEQLAPGPFGPVTGLRGVIGDGEALLVGARIGFDLTDDTTIYASAQTATDEKGLYEDNDLVTVGVNTRRFGSNAVSLEVSDGDRGSAVTAGLEVGNSDGLNFNVNGGVGSGAISQFTTRYSAADGHELYGSYTVDPDRTDGARNLLTLGQRRDFGDNLALFTESQFGRSDSYADVGHVFGLEFDGFEKLTISSTAQFSENNHSGIRFDRQALSLGASLRSNDLKLSSRVEYREDEGLAVHNRQYISSSSLSWRRSDERFWVGRLNFSWTDDELNGGHDARFVEFDLGHTLRPVSNDRFNLLSKYSFLYDLPSEGQNTNRADERSQLLSVEGLYDLSNRWEIAAKVAIRKGEIRLTRDSGPWQEFGLRMASVRARYNMARKWDALAEYRWLSDIEGTNDRHGALLGLYRHVGDNFKIGAGFNFTDFDSDLRIDRYDNRGWFLDLVGKY